MGATRLRSRAMTIYLSAVSAKERTHRPSQPGSIADADLSTLLSCPFCHDPTLTGAGEACLLVRWTSQDFRSISGTDGSYPLPLGLIRLLIELGRHCQ